MAAATNEENVYTHIVCLVPHPLLLNHGPHADDIDLEQVLELALLVRALLGEQFQSVEITLRETDNILIFDELCAVGYQERKVALELGEKLVPCDLLGVFGGVVERGGGGEVAANDEVGLALCALELDLDVTLLLVVFDERLEILSTIQKLE